ncbi:MAG: NosD domain-containing protein, partial [Actinomycetota bacterium]
SSNTVQSSLMYNPNYAGLQIWESSYNAVLDSTMTAADLSGRALEIRGSSWTTVARSMIGGGAGNGAYLYNGSAYNTITQSTMSTSGANRVGLFLDAAPSNTILQSYVQSLAGTGGYISNASHFNAIRQSTFVSVTASFFGVLLDNANDGEISDSRIVNTAGDALQIYGIRDVIVRTTMTAEGRGLFLIGASTISVFDSYIQGSTAAFVKDSTSAVIGGSVLVATNTIGSALALAGGNVNLTITTSTLLAPSLGRGLALNVGNAGVVSLSSVVFTGAGRGIEISTQVTGSFSLVVDSITFRGLALGATAVHFLGGTFVSTFTHANFEDA